MPARFKINVVLYAIPGAPEPNVARVQDELDWAISSFWVATGLPAKPEILVSKSADPVDLFDFNLELNGQPVPMPVFHPSVSTPDISFRIFAAVFANRSVLANNEQLRDIRARLIEKQEISAQSASAPIAIWRSFATLLLEHGFSLDRIATCLEHWNPGRKPEEVFEDEIGNLEALNLKLVVNPKLADTHSEADPGWAQRFPEFYREIYLELGIITPRIFLEKDKSLPEEQIRLQINDLWLPVWPGIKTGQALFDNSTTTANTFFLPGGNTRYSLEPLTANSLQEPVVKGPRAYIAEWVKYWIHECAGWFVNTALLDAQMDGLEESNRSLIVMIREQWPTSQLCPVFRALLAEKVSIRNLAEVLDVLLRIDDAIAIDDTQYMTYFPPVSRVMVIPPGALKSVPSPTQLAGHVRANLKYPVVFPHMEGGVLPCYTFDPVLLRDFRDGFFRNTLPVPGNRIYFLLKMLHSQLEADFKYPVFLVPSGSRYAVVENLKPYLPKVVVIGHEEVPAFFVPSVKATITLP